MNSVRRSLVRSATSVAAASRTTVAVTAATAPLAGSLASHAVRRPAAVQRVNLTALAAARAARYFSQTARAAEEEGAAAGAVSSESASSEPAREPPNGVYIRNMVFDATEDHIKEAFEAYGTVVKVVIARDPRGMSRGYGFVWFEEPESVDKAIKEAHGSFWHGRRLVVQQRVPRSTMSTEELSRTPRTPTDSLYVGNLPYETTDADLNEIFKNLEGLRSVRVAVDRSTGWPRGFAHADFDTVENAQAAFNNLADLKIGDRALRIDFSDSMSKYQARNAGQRSRN